MIASLCGLLLRALPALQLFITSPTGAPAPPRSKLNVVTFGVTNRQDPKGFLPGADQGASEIAAIFRGQQGTEVQSLLNEQVTCDAFEKKMADLKKRLARGENVVVYLSCHGGIWDCDWFFQLHDGEVNGRLLKEQLSGGPGKAILFLDSCHSSALFDGSGPDIRGSGNLMVYASCRSEEVSWFRAINSVSVSWIDVLIWRGDNSRALAEALRGKADANGDGIVTLTEIEVYMTRRVAELNEQFLSRMTEEKRYWKDERGIKVLTQTPKSNRPPRIDGDLGVVQVPKELPGATK